MKKILVFAILIQILFVLTAFAQVEEGRTQGYEPLEPLVSPRGTYRTVNLSSYLEWLFTFGISIAGILAVLMIVIGGIQYMTAYGNPASLQSAKDRIFYAILGLILAISAWLILYTINPDLIKGVLRIPPLSSRQETSQSQPRVIIPFWYTGAVCADRNQPHQPRPVSSGL